MSKLKFNSFLYLKELESASSRTQWLQAGFFSVLFSEEKSPRSIKNTYCTIIMKWYD